MRTPSSPGNHGRLRLSRRGLLALGVTGLATRASPVARITAAEEHGSQTAPHTWRTWLLLAADELRPAPPSPPTETEVDELVAFQTRRSASTAATVTKWGSGPAVLPWTELALDLIRLHQPSPVHAARALALLHTALFDAVVATLDARAAHPRPAPWVTDRTLVPLGEGDGSDSSFPSEHAAVAEAAVAVLTSLFPEEPADALTALAEEAAMSRIWAGRCYRSDVEAGGAIGRAVGERAVMRGETDGSGEPWTSGNRPTGEGFWQPTPPAYTQQPLDPLAGTWRTWVVGDVAQYRPTAPPVYRSPAWEAELAAVQDAVVHRTPAQEEAARYWEGGPGTVTPGGQWIEIARDLVVAQGLDLPHVAHVLALTSVAIADAFICCWDAKYTYWMARPITADPTLDVSIPTPPFPSYPSGHATISAAGATLLGHLVPDEDAELAARAEEARNSRLWAGIHFPIDNDMGAVAGKMVGRLVALRAREDGGA